MSAETRPMTICLFCVSPIEKLRRTVDAVTKENDLMNTIEGLGGALRRALSLTSLSGVPIGQKCSLCPVTPKIISILDSHDRMCKLKEQVNQLKSNHEAIMGDLLSDCDLVKEELQLILDVCKATEPETTPSSAGILNGACNIRIEGGNFINLSGTSNPIIQESTTLPSVIMRRHLLNVYWLWRVLQAARLPHLETLQPAFQAINAPNSNLEHIPSRHAADFFLSFATENATAFAFDDLPLHVLCISHPFIAYSVTSC